MDDKIYSVEIVNLSVGYAGIPIVTDIQIKSSAGEVVGLIGQNGSGKSTILRTISGLIPAINGDVFIGGHKVTEESIRSRVRKYGMGFVPQNNRNIPNLTVCENLHISQWDTRSWKDRQKKIDHLLQVDPFDQLADALNTSASALSGGQDMLLSIAAQILQDCRIILLDEPSSGLDEGNRELITTMINDLKKQNKTIILVEQYLRVLFAISDRVYTIHPANGSHPEHGVGDEYVNIVMMEDLNKVKMIKDIYNANAILTADQSDEIDDLLWNI